jgi:exodeoxyribonuclease V alpha subunit
VAVLRRSYRFDAESGIGSVARAVNAGNGDLAVAVLTDAAYPDAVLEPLSVEGLEPYLRAWLLPRMGACLAEPDPRAVLTAFNRFRILCAVREGPCGVRAVNRLCERVLEEAGVIDPGGREQYAGRPLLVTRNDYGLGLYNGDVGLVLPDAAGEGLRAWFETGDGPRRVLTQRLPAHETLYAMTVHKSQGSELDEILLVLPDADSRALTRELLYTAITRARRRVTILARAERIRSAADRPVRRSSGLYETLWLRP